VTGIVEGVSIKAGLAPGCCATLFAIIHTRQTRPSNIEVLVDAIVADNRCTIIAVIRAGQTHTLVNYRTLVCTSRT